MSYQANLEYLATIADRYKKASKAQKSRMLTEAETVTKLTRKHLSRVLKKPKEQILRKKQSGRPSAYPRSLLLPHLLFLWTQMERISAKRMKAAYPDWLPFYKAEGFTREIRFMIERMSVSTLERILRGIRASQAVTHGLATTSPARYMKNKIPINTLDAKIDKPGFFQADTVAHCGDSAAGNFINSVTLTDIFSAWTVNRAMWKKQGHEVRKRFTELHEELVFPILGINTDSGSEFLNTPVLNFTIDKRIVFTRSRPYKKNDNCYVEQKNFTHVRELFGYERFDEQRLVSLMNEIYSTCWNPLQNYFLPTFKLKEKIRVGARIVKKYDKPETPYDRLMRSQHLTEAQRGKLRDAKKSLNPFKLKTELEARLKIFFEEVRKSKARTT